MTIISDVGDYLEVNGIGTLGTNLFKSYLPDNANAGIAVLDTGGLKPDVDLPTKSPTFQILIKSTTYSSGKAKLDSVRSLLHRKFNSELVAGQNYFYYILAQSEGGHLGKNERGLHEFSINFYCLTR
jgi:hypothetical protein